MTDHDAFELRFHAAIRGYVGRVSSDLEPAGFAHRIAAAEPRRQGFAGALRLRTLDARGRTWALLLLAGLVAALLGGALVIGSHRQPKLPAVVPPVGPVSECPPGSNPNKPGPADQARPPLDVPTAAAFDRRAGRLVALAGAGISPETWTFDVCANTWTRMHPNGQPFGVDGDDRLVYDIDSHVTIAQDRHTGRVWAYDMQADAWTAKGAPPTGATLGTYDPGSGLVVARRGPDVWSYDVETDTWAPIQTAVEPRPGNVVFGYDASVDRMVGYAYDPAGTPETWLLDVRTGTWSRSSVETPLVVGGFGLPRTIEYDGATKRIVVVGNAAAAAYDATADRWEMLVAYGVARLPDPMAYDPLNERLVGTTVGGRVEALDPVTRELTVLLEPIGG